MRKGTYGTRECSSLEELTQGCIRELNRREDEFVGETLLRRWKFTAVSNRKGEICNWCGG
jgi:hypothetical protein